jgi:hypothetical protein
MRLKLNLKRVKISPVDVAKGRSKGGSLIVKPYSRGGPRKNIQLKI